MKPALVLPMFLATCAFLQGKLLSATVCPPAIVTDRVYGGEATDYLRSMIVVSNRGFLTVGGTTSTTMDVTNRHRGADVWAALVRPDGGLAWSQAYGGAAWDEGAGAVTTDDGGFVIAGSSASGVSDDKSAPGFGDADYWILRVDSNGTRIWDGTYGGTGGDWLRAIVRASDGGYLLAGTSSSDPGGNKTAPNRNAQSFVGDVWLVRLDGDGNILWDRSYGGDRAEDVAGIAPASDGGFVIGATSYSGATGNKTVEGFGQSDYWVFQIDASGEIVWQKAYGGESADEASMIIAVPSGGYFLGGRSYSLPGGNKQSPAYGSYDFWLLRLDQMGDRVWETSFGGTRADLLTAAQVLPDGGLLSVGNSSSPADETKTGRWYGQSDMVAVRWNAAGEKLWDQTYGGLLVEDARAVALRDDGGFLIAGSSSSPPRGNKSAPNYGDSDAWLIQLNRETPDDCDGDTIPDAVDQCPDTTFGDFIDSQGCGLKQACPCAGTWSDKTQYIECVATTSSRFVSEGVMTPAQRESVLAAAAEDSCPILPTSFVAFGLTNVAIGSATLEYGSQLTISETSSEGDEGVSVRLGLADSGIFISPYADIWASYDESWFVRGVALGTVNGTHDAPVATVRATKPYYEQYPVHVDLSPLGPASVTWQVWSNSVLVRETTVTEASGTVTFYSASQVGPRVNPFWRLPDGNVGTLIELTERQYAEVTISGPFGDVATGDRVFVRADQLTNTVSGVSMVNIYVGGGLWNFTILNESPGVFRHVHQALNNAVLNAAIDRLEVGGLSGPFYQAPGVLIETAGENRRNLIVEPIALTNQSSLRFSLGTLPGGANDYGFGGEVLVTRQMNELSLSTEFASTVQAVEIRVYRSGIFQGAATGLSSTILGRMMAVNGGDSPKIIAAGGGLEEEGSTATFALTFHAPVVFTGTNGVPLTGEHLRIVGQSGIELGPLVSVAMTVETPKWVIIAESSEAEPAPVAIHRLAAGYELSWGARNSPVVLEATMTLPGEFMTVAVDPEYQDGRYRVVVPSDGGTSRFFRLRRVE